MTTKPPPDFPRWIPSAARNKILELRQRLRQREDSTPEELAVLDRLATSYVMRTDVWQKLPPRAAGMEGLIIEWTLIGSGLAAAAIRPPITKNKAEIAKHLTKYPTKRTAQDAATVARILLKAMVENRQDAEGIWEAYTQITWRGQRLSYLEARNIVEWLAYFFEVLWAKNRAVAAVLKLPKIRKKQAAKAKEVYLSQFLSQRFSDEFDNWHDSIVGALVGVALDLEPGPEAATIRGRRRRQRKISSKK
jgi:hypothetical protein